MLFNSWVFIVAFLPIILIGFYLLKAYATPAIAKTWLGGASLFFYGWWNAWYLLVLLASTVANFYAGRLISAQPPGRPRTAITGLALAGNLAVLCYFKYIAFFAGVIDQAFGLAFVVHAVALPLGISFFTFQKIGYLVDVHAGQPAEKSWINFLLFVSFFPQLIAGPIVHHREVLPQFARTQGGRPDPADMSVGLTLFAIGLFKKTVLADPIGTYATLIFDTAGRGLPLTMAESWVGALSYTFQLYFDFSGYSDMAIGLARMFGVRLPMNFSSPYKSLNIIEFWRRWHITLSRLLRDYLYIPLGGNRHGVARRYINLMLVMLIGGLWHGAGWTFIIWGGLHGCYLLINHTWNSFGQKHAWLRFPDNLAGRSFAYGLTFGPVVFAWVFFRAPSVHVAWAMVKSMLDVAASVETPHGEWLRQTVMGDVQQGLMLLVALWLIATAAPNSQTLLRRFEPALNWRTYVTPPAWAESWLTWRPNLIWGLFTAGCLAVALLRFSNVSEFIYFNF